MKKAQNAVYCVCATDDRWEVVRDASSEPVASFNDKHAALAYALSLAKRSPEPYPPVGRRQDSLRNTLNRSFGTRGTSL